MSSMHITKASLYTIPVEMRMPLKFGSESVSSVVCARVSISVEGSDGTVATGWGETPLSVTWAWPSQELSYRDRYDAMLKFCVLLVERWVNFNSSGHALEIGHQFLEEELPTLLDDFNRDRDYPMPHLAALIATSAIDIALHDAYGNLNEADIYQLYSSEHLSEDLSHFLSSDEQSFSGKFPSDFLATEIPNVLPVWHLVGGLDPLTEQELTGDEPSDGYPTTLEQWLNTDGLDCLKIKLRGNDSQWDYERIVKIGELAKHQCRALSADFNCTVTDPEYVNEILDRLAADHRETFESILYVEQPFPYDLENNRIDVQSVSQRKPLFLDESAHDWRFIRLGRDLGWTGVALKTCKTQTGALLSLCWARAHGMPLMVQDLTNPMLAQIPHVRLAAHADTIMGVESNGMQFYPAASAPEAEVHPGIYRRRNGQLDLSSISGSGFGYRLNEIERSLAPPIHIVER